MKAEYDPLTAPAPEEVPLPDAPLVRVIAQVRFPLILSVEKREYIAPFQEAIRGEYPLLRQEQAQGLVLGTHGVAPGPKQMAWRFTDLDDAWRVSLTPEFLALETTVYKSRANFLDRLGIVVAALAEHFSPAVVQRLGLRYIDRVTGGAVDDISKLVRPEVLGLGASTVSAHARHTLTETLFDLPENDEQLLARWGLVPSGGTVDPNAIEPIEEPSWILDIDMFSTKQRAFTPDNIVVDARRYSERLYSLFRWVVTDAFLARYGGEL